MTQRLSKIGSVIHQFAILPNEAAIVRLVGAILLEQNDEWAGQRGRYMTLQTMAPLSNDPIVGLPRRGAPTNPAHTRNGGHHTTPVQHASGTSQGRGRPSPAARLREYFGDRH